MPKNKILKNPRPRKKSDKKKVKVEISAGGIVFRKLKAQISNVKGGEKFEILLIKDSYGRWALPKGHIEKKESVDEAAQREVSEETGLKKLKIIKKLDQTKFFFRWKNHLVLKIVYHFLFLADPKEKPKAQTEEIKGIKWADFSQAKKIIAYQNLKPVLEKAKKYLTSNNLMESR